MILKKTVTTLALVMVASVMSAAGSTEVTAGGYGYGTGHSWSGSQGYMPKRRTAHRQVYAGNNRHLAWCYGRYRSYRLTDNTFQPYHGPRRECLSPYEQERRALFVGYPGEAPEILFRDQAGRGQVEPDRFGNVPEGGPADPLSSGETAPSTDAFGNLPEQAAAGGAVTPAADAPQAGAPAEAPVLKVPSAEPPAAEPREAASTDGPQTVSERPAETAATPELQVAPAENVKSENGQAENLQAEDAPTGETAREVPVD